jgi:hypothetical protein
MERGRQEVVVRVQEEVSVEEAAGVAGWGVIVPAPGPVVNVSALIVGHVYHIKWVTPAITRVALNAEQRWYEVKNIQ